MALRATHDAEADAAYVYLTDAPDAPVAETRELVPDTVMADYAADGSLVGIEFLWVSDGVELDGLDLPRAKAIEAALLKVGVAVNPTKRSTDATIAR